jgi:hypothetical protein
VAPIQSLNEDNLNQSSVFDPPPIFEQSIFEQSIFEQERGNIREPILQLLNLQLHASAVENNFCL